MKFRLNTASRIGFVSALFALPTSGFENTNDSNGQGIQNSLNPDSTQVLQLDAIARTLPKLYIEMKSSSWEELDGVTQYQKMAKHLISAWGGTEEHMDSLQSMIDLIEKSASDLSENDQDIVEFELQSIGQHLVSHFVEVENSLATWTKTEKPLTQALEVLNADYLPTYNSCLEQAKARPIDNSLSAHQQFCIELQNDATDSTTNELFTSVHNGGISLFKSLFVHRQTLSADLIACVADVRSNLKPNQEKAIE